MHQLSQRLVGKMAAVLLVAGGLGSLSRALLPAFPGLQPLGITAVSLTAIAIGVVVWFLPWERWSPRATLVLVPIAFTLIALGNHFSAAEPFRYGIYFVVAFAWIGFAHPLGTSLAFMPLFVAAYVVPLFSAGAATVPALTSLAIVGPICLAVGESMAWVSTRLRRAELDVERLRRERYFRSLIQNASDVIMILDRTAHIRYHSPSLEHVLGWTPGPGATILEQVHPGDRPAVQAALNELVGRPGAEAHLEFRVMTASGSARVAEAIMQNHLEEEDLRGVVLTFRDATERKELEEQLRHQAFHDPLTGLANRMRLAERIEHALARTERSARLVAVMLIDLDDFKAVNDSYGHDVGDAVLATVAARLERCIRPGDTAARLGGDEFAVLLDEVEPVEAEAVADRVLAGFGEPIVVQGHGVMVRASMGLDFGRAPYGRAADLLRNADAAMYSAKARGKNAVVVFGPGTKSSSRTRTRATGRQSPAA